MSRYVVDCSVTMAWLMEDEASAETEELLARLSGGDDDVLVPGIWRWELGNALIQAERRGRTTISQTTTVQKFVDTLSITTENDDSRALKEVFNLARAESLTTYDAAYLELAMRHKIPLATLDKALVDAAARNNIKTLPV